MDVAAPDFPVRESFRAMNCPALPTDAMVVSVNVVEIRV